MKGDAVPVRLRQALPKHVYRGASLEIKGAPFHVVRISSNRLIVWVRPGSRA